MKLQKIGILAVTILTLTSQAMEKPCTSIDDLRNDGTSYYSWLPQDLHNELYKFATNDSAFKWALHKHAESVGFKYKRLKDHTGPICCLAMDKVNMWNLENGEYEKTLYGHMSGITCLVLANNKIISGSSNEIKIWNRQTGQCEKTLYGHTDSIRCLAITNNTIISGSEDTTIKIWDLEAGQCEKTLHGHTEWIDCLVVANNTIISGSFDTTIKIWDLVTGHCQKTLQGHTKAIICLIVANNKIISGSRDETIKIWNRQTGHCEKILQGHDSWIRSLEVTNNLIISASRNPKSWDGTIKIWDLESGHCCYSLKVPLDLSLIDAGAGHLYCIFGNDIIIYELEDTSLKNSLEKSMDTAYLLMAAYECSQNKKELDLKTNAWLYNAFMRLPSALQEIIREQITVRLPWSFMLFRLGSRRA